LDLDDLVGPIREKEAGPKEMPLSDLLNAIDQKEDLPSHAIAERMEFHQRISFGFVPLVFCILGVSLTLMPRGARANRSWGFMLCIFWLVIYYTLLSLGKALGDKNFLPPIPAVWLPNLVIGAIGIYFFRKAMRESPFFFPFLLERGAAATRRIFARPKAKTSHEAAL